MRPSPETITGIAGKAHAKGDGGVWPKRQRAIAEHERWLVGGVTVAGAVLRLYGLGTQSLWYDELYTAFLVRGDWAQIVSGLIQSDVHPPLAYLLIHAAALTGSSEASLRFIPSLFSIFTIPLFYYAVRQWFDQGVALVASVLLVLDPFQVLFAQEARMYAQLAFLTLGSQFFFWRAWQAGRRCDWLLFALATSLAFYTHNLAFLNLFALDIFALLHSRRLRSRMQPLAASHLVIAALFLPWLPSMGQQLSRVSSGFWGSAPTALNLLTTPYLLLFGNAVPLLLVPVALFAGLALLVFALFALVRAWRARLPEAEALSFALASFGVPLLSLFLLAQIRPIFVERTLIATSFGLIAILAWAIVHAPPRLLMRLFGLAIGLVLLGALPQYYFNADVQKPNFRAAAQELLASLSPGDVVAHTSDSSALAFAYYLPSVPTHFLTGDPDFAQNTERAVADRYVGLSPEPATVLTAGHARVWLIVALDHSEDYQLAQVAAFDKAYVRTATHEVNGIRLLLYQTSGATP